MTCGVLLNDTGRWSEALVSLDEAKKIALEIGDEVGYFCTQSNSISTYFLRGEYQRVLNLTDPLRLPPNAVGPLSAIRCMYLLNRASSAVSMRAGSIAIESGYEAVALSASANDGVNLLHDAIARHMLIRGLLFAKDVSRAELVLSGAFPASPASPRATIQLKLADAAISIYQFKWHRATELIESILTTSTALASKRDALILKISLQEAANDSAGLMDTLGLLSDEVVAHRANVVRDSLSINELLAPVLHNLASDQSERPRSVVAEQLIRILDGSESEASHCQRKEIAALSSRLAEHMGFGTPWCRQIERAAMLRDLGKFTNTSLVFEPSSAASAAITNFEVMSTMKLLSQCGFDEDSLEFKTAHQRYERVDGSGLQGMRSDSICREAQIVSICEHYFIQLSAAGFSEEAHRSFIARAMYASGRWYSTEITAQFATFVERLWRSGYFKKDHDLSMDQGLGSVEAS